METSLKILYVVCVAVAPLALSAEAQSTPPKEQSEFSSQATPTQSALPSKSESKALESSAFLPDSAKSKEVATTQPEKLVPQRGVNKSGVANLFYFAVGAGVGFGGPGRNINANKGVFLPSISLGVAHSFNHYFGVRPYVNFDIVRFGGSIPKDRRDDDMTNVFASVSGSLNIDGLVNFYVNKKRNFHFGGIVGIGVASGYGGFLELDDNRNANNSDAGIGYFGSFNVNLGLKATWNRKNGLELIVRIPTATWGSGYRASEESEHRNMGPRINKPYVNGAGISLAYSRSL